MLMVMMKAAMTMKDLSGSGDGETWTTLAWTKKRSGDVDFVSPKALHSSFDDD